MTLSARLAKIIPAPWLKRADKPPLGPRWPAQWNGQIGFIESYAEVEKVDFSDLPLRCKLRCAWNAVKYRSLDWIDAS